MSSGGPHGAIHHPFPFSPEMVRALMAGRKTQDRRMVGSRAAHVRAGHLIWVKEAVVRDSGLFAAVGYQADGALPEGKLQRSVDAEYMPRQASRLTLAVTGWRMERLRDISAADAVAEGFWSAMSDPEQLLLDPREAFFSHWERRHPGGGSNPTVIVLEFSTEVRNIDAWLEEQAANSQSARRGRTG